MAGNPYESDELLSQYLLFHYGSAAEQMPYGNGPVAALDYPVRCVQEAFRSNGKTSSRRALDLGCAVGRSTFELARFSEKAVGIDFSNRFIDAAQALQKLGKLPYARLDEGELSTPLVAQVPEDIDRSRATFLVGDACALPESLETFDLVLMANLIDRLPRPADCLRQMKDLIEKDGLLVITSPYTWMREFTPRIQWLGGRLEVGESIKTLDGLKWILGAHFQLLGTKDIPFVIREHARKYQWSVAEGSFWKRK